MMKTIVWNQHIFGNFRNLLQSIFKTILISHKRYWEITWFCIINSGQQKSKLSTYTLQQKEIFTCYGCVRSRLKNVYLHNEAKLCSLWFLHCLQLFLASCMSASCRAISSYLWNIIIGLDIIPGTRHWFMGDSITILRHFATLK